MSPKETLQTWLRDQKIPAAEFARRVDYDKGNFHRLLHGDLWPTLELAHRIEKQTAGAIPMAAWAEAKAA